MTRIPRLAAVSVLLLCLCTLAGLAGAPSATAGEAGFVPVQILGAEYSVWASDSRGKTRVSVKSAGRLDPETPTRVSVRLTVKPDRAAVRRIEAEGLSWRIDHREPRTTVAVALRILSSDDPGCRAGARGSLTVLDDDTRLPSRRSSDTVRLRFAGGRCRALTRLFTNAVSSQKARVEVDLDLGPPS